MSNLPVIIAGCGPVGSCLALSLAKAGLDVVVLEREDSLPIDLRASTFHPPSLEMIADMDDQVIAEMLEKGLKVDRYQYRDRKSGDVATFDMKAIADETPYPYRLQLEQYELTMAVERRLPDYPNVDLRFGHEVSRFEDHGESVEVFYNGPDGEGSLRGCWLIGSEGARSNVRKTAGIGYTGFTYDEKFLVVSTNFPLEDVFEDLSWVNYVADPDEWCVILRTDKIWRVLFPTEPGADEDLLLSDDFIQERMKHLHDKGSDYDIGHRTLYAVNQRVAETYYKGRIILAGDACHINNPLGGMGMNGGLHDAFNLAPRLVRIEKESADPIAELDQYNRQRRDLAVRFVQDHTIQNKKLMESTDPEIQKKRQAWLMETASDPVKARAFIMERAMIDCVRDSLNVK